jgi:hypothetical protein
MDAFEISETDVMKGRVIITGSPCITLAGFVSTWSGGGIFGGVFARVKEAPAVARTRKRSDDRKKRENFIP